MKPFFELTFAPKNTLLGIELEGFRPVVPPSSTKGWQYEYVFIRGRDLTWSPWLSHVCKPAYRVDQKEIKESVMKSMVELVKVFGVDWTKFSFHKRVDLKAHNLYLERSMDLLDLMYDEDEFLLTYMGSSHAPRPEEVSKSKGVHSAGDGESVGGGGKTGTVGRRPLWD